MKMSKESLIKKYVRDVRTLFPIHGKTEKAYLKKMAENMEDFAADHDFSSMEELYAEFGDPKDAIYQYYSTLDAADLFKIIKLRNLLKYVIAFTCAIFLAAFLFVLAILYQEHQLLMREEATYTIITTTEYEVSP